MKLPYKTLELMEPEFRYKDPVRGEETKLPLVLDRYDNQFYVLTKKGLLLNVPESSIRGNRIRENPFDKNIHN